MDPKVRGQKLLDAISKDKFDDALKLLQQPVDFTVQQSGDNALHLAARKGRLDIIKVMVDKGADIKQKNQNGNTVAHYAAKEGYLDILQYLKRLRVDMNTNNNDGSAPLHGAVINQPMDVIEIMVDFGMNPNVTNRTTGETPVHTAIAYGRLPAVEGLLLKGGVPDIKDKSNRKPEELARTEEMKQMMLSYTSLYAALQSGFVQATGMKITKESVTNPLSIDRVGIILETIDIPKEFPTTFYCRRELAENSSVPIKTRDEEHVFSDVFHVQISDVMRDCKTNMFLPIYQVPPEKEQLVLRFLGADADDDRVIDKVETIEKDKDGVANGKVPHCLVETTLVPETTCVCIVYTRPKQEDKTVPEDGMLIRSAIEENFQLDVPAQAFDTDTRLSLKVYDSNVEEMAKKSAKQDSQATSLTTDVFQVNVSGTQPKKPVQMQLPTFGGNLEAEELAIVTMDENSLDNNEDLPEVVQVVPTVVNTNIVFEVSHFCIYVAVPKTCVGTEEDLLSLKRQISDAKNRRKPATFLAVCRQVKGRQHTLLVECGLEKRKDERINKWQAKGYEQCNNFQSKTIMLAPGDTFYVDIKGNASFETKSNAVKRKIAFSQCRSSFQAYAIKLDKGVFRPEDATADVVIYKKNGREREDVFTLQVQLHIPPPTSHAEQNKDVQFEFIPPINCMIGDNMNVGVMIRNATKMERTVNVRMTLSTIEGMTVTKIKEETLDTALEAMSDEQCMMVVTAKEYQVAGGKDSEFNLTTHCTVVETSEMFISVEKFSLQKPTINIECEDTLPIGTKSTAIVSFKNSTNLTLHGGMFNVNANFIAENKKLYIKRDIGPGETASVDVKLTPRKVGKWPIATAFTSDELSEVREVKVINVTK